MKIRICGIVVAAATTWTADLPGDNVRKACSKFAEYICPDSSLNEELRPKGKHNVVSFERC